ncbi:hypothetical protein MNBD_GAMMA26-219 [hydrothermal vent metagenome]|uniref:AB hydrolase-1 domain-containing protein n=1 Tax=hydrothermal vent metagenome TaxID=652676 RepID=A0A3B1B3B1_9ZZZZ
MDRQQEMVVLIHGIWMTGLEMFLLRHCLLSAGYSVSYFQYPSLGSPPGDNAAALADFIHDQEADTIHLVAHSLGGIVLMHLFNQSSDLPPGRVVLLGSPVHGSMVAHRITKLPGLGRLLGHSVDQGLTGGAPEWVGGRDLGVIAGTLNMGVGWLVGGVERPNDGTVSVVETQLPGATDSCTQCVSHFGLLFSRKTAKAVIQFLQRGQFVGFS